MWDASIRKPEGGRSLRAKARRSRFTRGDQASSLPKISPRMKSCWPIGGRRPAAGSMRSSAARCRLRSDLDFEQTEASEQGTYVRMAGLLKNKSHGEELPLAYLVPNNWNGRAVIWLSEKGKAALFADDG